ncbi:hypothetical protein F7Q90_26225, partial [Pantoea stewartii subsp. stewartii]
MGWLKCSGIRISYLDALRLAGKTASIVYAPGHAFLSWTDEQTGAPVWWETTALLNKWILCCGTMKTVVSDNIKSMHYMLAYDGVLSGISVFY